MSDLLPGSAVVVLPWPVARGLAGLVPWSCPFPWGEADLGQEQRQVWQIVGSLG